MRRLVLIVVALLVMVVPALAQDTPPTIADLVVASASGEAPEFSTLLTAVQAADPAILQALSDPAAELTVFAPTDAAFAALRENLGDDAFNAVLADQKALSDILLFHVVNGKVMSADVVAALAASTEGKAEGTLGAFSVPSLQGQYIDIAQTEDGGITINGANLNLNMVDIEAANGVIHVIDSVILPESRTIAELVVDTAGQKEGAEFTSLLAAVQAADPSVLEALSNPEAELTVFAPTDAAFAALGEDTLKAVLADQPALSDILRYHVVPGVVRSGDLAALMKDAPMDGLKVNTALENQQVTFAAAEDGSVTINNAKIIMTDIDAANGVIHVIDAVILPPTE